MKISLSKQTLFNFVVVLYRWKFPQKVIKKKSLPHLACKSRRLLGFSFLSDTKAKASASKAQYPPSSGEKTLLLLLSFFCRSSISHENTVLNKKLIKMHYKHFLTVQGILKLCDISHVHFDKTNLVSCNLLLQDEKGSNIHSQTFRDGVLHLLEIFRYKTSKKKKKTQAIPPFSWLEPPVTRSYSISINSQYFFRISASITNLLRVMKAFIINFRSLQVISS